VKLRNLLLIAFGIFVGYKLAAKMREDDPNVLSGPRRESSRTARTVSAQAQRLADQATTKSLDMIKRARGSLRDRAGSDEAVWN
jgi:cell division septum initiation protein DivIVA